MCSIMLKLQKCQRQKYYSYCFQSAKQSGSVIIVIVAAIIVLSALSLWMSTESSVSVLNQLELNKADAARNLAYSGVEYVKGLSYSYQSQNKTFSDFYNDLTSNSGTYSVGTDAGSFVVTVPSYSTSGSTTTYTVNVVGVTPSGFGQAKYQIPNAVSLTYTYTAGVNPDVPQALYVANTINFSGNYYSGDSIFSTATFNGGQTIAGSLDYITSGSSCLLLNGGGSKYGNTDGSSHICSTTCIVLSGWGTVYGTMTAQGDITIQSGNVYGDIYSGGNVTIYGNSTVHGNVNAVGSISIISGQITGDQTKLGSKPSSCVGYSLKDYVSLTPTQSAVNLGWVSSPYIITGSENINDKTWVFPSFKMSNGGTYLCLDLSTDNSYVNIFVNGDFSLSGQLQLKVSPSGQCTNASSFTLSDQKKYAKRIYMAVGGKTTFSSSAHNWIGTIFSQGNIKATSTMDVVGALYSKGTVDTGGGTSTYFVMSDYANTTW